MGDRECLFSQSEVDHIATRAIEAQWGKAVEHEIVKRRNKNWNEQFLGGCLAHELKKGPCIDRPLAIAAIWVVVREML